jgi:class 3 adenylate cyclase/tetratricopeptide (TPR) repeat protein
MSLCPRCAGVSPPGARFCPACGTPLIAVPDTRFASPDTYTPPHLAARILGSRSALAGERKQVTVLFADVKGSMELFADRDPEQASRILEETLGLMLEAVHRYEGTVNQVMGDGIMALFGAPLAREDHAVRACYAALRMQERVTAYGDALQREQALPVQIRVGLNSGEVVVRSIGSDLHMAYTAVGQTVNLAARMEQMAKPASILATAETTALAGSRVVTRPLGPIPVRGLAEPVEVHELVGAARLRSRLEGLDARALVPVVGREAELERLLDALSAVRAGRGQVVSLVGEAGVGKSRLLREVTRLGRSEGWLVLEVAGVSFGRAMGYSAGVEMHRQYFEVEDSDSPGVIRDKVGRKLAALDPALEDGVPAILWRLNALPPGSAFLALDAATRRRRADEMSLRIIGSESRRRPAIVVVEDLQWIDAATLDSLSVFVRRVPPSTLVLVSHRPDVEAPIASPVHVQIRLEPLPSAGARELLDGLLGADPALDDVKQLLIERAGGNPLFLEECVRSLVGAGTLEGERGAYRLRRSVVTVEAPAGVRSVLAARIDRLPPDQKWLLQAASVIGDEVPVRLLEAIADTPAEEVRRALGELRSAELLDETALFPDLEYRFTHSLTHDVAYESLLHELRRAVHERIVDAIERVEADRLVERTERLAHHAFLGEVWDRAVAYCRAAGARALARLSSREAVAWFERALAALGHWPDSPEARALAVDLRHELHGALVPQGDHARMLAVLGEAEALAEALGDERRLARALSLRGTTLWELGRSRQALDVGARGLAIAERTGAIDLQAVGNYSMGGAARAVGDYPRAVALLRRNHALLQGELAQETFGLAGLASVLSLGHLVWSLAELGEFEDAIPLAEGAIRLAQKADHAFSLAHAHLGLGGALLRRGQIWEAAAVLERGIALCADVPTLFPPMAGDLSVVSALSGRLERALQLGEQGVARAEAMGRMGRLSLIVTHLGETCVVAGRPKEATRHAERALDLATQGGERGNQVYALRLLGVIAAEQDPPDADAAHERFGRALALAEDLGMRPLAARCHLGLGRLARRIGDTGAAATHLGRAAEMLAEMGMTFWLERMTLDHVGPAHS